MTRGLSSVRCGLTFRPLLVTSKCCWRRRDDDVVVVVVVACCHVNTQAKIKTPPFFFFSPPSLPPASLFAVFPFFDWLKRIIDLWAEATFLVFSVLLGEQPAEKRKKAQRTKKRSRTKKMNDLSCHNKLMSSFEFSSVVSHSLKNYLIGK